MPARESRWRPDAARIIGEVIERVGREDLKVLRRAIRAAYPFGRRSGWPYKIWCSEVRSQVDGCTGKKSEVLPGQKGLFSHGERRVTHQSILRNKRRVIAELEQMIRDVTYWNTLPQASGQPINVDAEKVAVQHARRSEQFWLDHRTKESADEWQLVINALSPSPSPALAHVKDRP